MTTIELILPAADPPSLMSPEEKQEYGIEEIPMDKIKDRASQLGVSQETIDKIQKSGEKVVYFAHHMPVKIKVISK